MSTMEFREVLLDGLIIDHSYQRTITKDEIQKLADKWNDLYSGIITLAKRSDGKLFVVDGQRRVLAARLVGLKSLPAAIRKFDSVEEEAAFFNGLNTRKEPSQLDRFKARKRMGDPVVLEIDKIARKNGFNITRKGEKALYSVKVLEFLHTQGTLNRVLELMSSAWPKVTENESPLVLKAFQSMYSHHGEAVDDKRLLSTIKSRRITSWVNDARETTLVNGGITARNLANLWIGHYNKGLQERGRRLKPIPRSSKLAQS